ncbi:hypothetical protein BC835DRAFT_1306550 [Cytidiella melzeri]|nr:hypothetical protein BC835DRAFT_1306550 [Cytidiella melzeri]
MSQEQKEERSRVEPQTQQGRSSQVEEENARRGVGRRESEPFRVATPDRMVEGYAASALIQPFAAYALRLKADPAYSNSKHTSAATFAFAYEPRSHTPSLRPTGHRLWEEASGKDEVVCGKRNNTKNIAGVERMDPDGLLGKTCIRWALSTGSIPASETRAATLGSKR